jgi:sec-independent protein translocase protein TatC
MSNRGMTSRRTSRRPAEDSEANSGGMMGFLEHLDELRRRLIRSLIALGTSIAVAFLFLDHIADFVLGPTLRALPEGAKLVTTRPGEGIAFYFDLALIGGVVLAAPFITYQIWRFVAPGLYAREKRLAIPVVLMATVGTVAGAAFAHYLLYPTTIEFFARFNSRFTAYMPRLEDTFGLYKGLLLAMVAVFQIPTLVFFLATIGLVTARFLWRHTHYAVLIIFSAAALLTSSPDWWNQTIVALPMLAMYLLSIAVAWLAGPRDRDAADRGDHPFDDARSRLKLVITASMIDQVRRRHRAESAPRQWPRAL